MLAWIMNLGFAASGVTAAAAGSHNTWQPGARQGRTWEPGAGGRTWEPGADGRTANTHVDRTRNL